MEGIRGLIGAQLNDVSLGVRERRDSMRGVLCALVQSAFQKEDETEGKKHRGKGRRG